jgi:hypothetical protein
MDMGDLRNSGYKSRASSDPNNLRGLSLRSLAAGDTEDAHHDVIEYLHRSSRYLDAPCIHTLQQGIENYFCRWIPG